MGKKVAPIFQMVSDNMSMGESLDIIAKVDSDPRFGENKIKIWAYLLGISHQVPLVDMYLFYASRP